MGQIHDHMVEQAWSVGIQNLFVNLCWCYFAFTGWFLNISLKCKAVIVIYLFLLWIHLNLHLSNNMGCSMHVFPSVTPAYVGLFHHSVDLKTQVLLLQLKWVLLCITTGIFLAGELGGKQWNVAWGAAVRLHWSSEAGTSFTCKW